MRYIKLFFSDVFGNIKSISIQPSELERAFLEGIPFDAGAIPGFLNFAQSDLFVVPDASTLCVLPWRPQSGRVVRFFCSIHRADGTIFEGDTRKILFDFVEKTKERGLEFQIGTECEFYLFKRDENGEPTHIPHDYAGYCDLAPRDRGENVRREICLTLEQMGVHPESSHHESGAGQNEIDFKSSDPFTAADNLQTFKVVVNTIAAKNGLFASFLPKPFAGAGNGLHVNVSIFEGAKNLFESNEISKKAENFIAGVLKYASELCAFTNPLPSSYSRLGEFEAPRFVSWSRQNQSQLIRVPFSRGETRMELRSPDPSANPYLCIYLILLAGIKGIDESLSLGAAHDLDLQKASAAVLQNVQKLPHSLVDAISIAKNSDFLKNALPKSVLSIFFDNIRQDFEWGEF